jgi:hypothetical protein
VVPADHLARKKRTFQSPFSLRSGGLHRRPLLARKPPAAERPYRPEGDSRVRKFWRSLHKRCIVTTSFRKMFPTQQEEEKRCTRSP